MQITDFIEKPADLIILFPLWLGGMFIATAIARNGWLEIGIKIPPDKTAITGMVIGAIALAGSIVVRWIDPEFNIKTSHGLLALILSTQFGWLFFYHYVFLPKSQYDYNRAIIRSNYWSGKYLTLGRLDQSLANELKSFSRAQDAVSLFLRAIATQEKGQKVFHLENVIDLTGRDDEADWYGNFRLNCCNCGSQISYPLYSQGRQQSGQCMCGAMITGRIINNQLYLNTMLPKAQRLCLPQNRHNVANGRLELARLYRMMGEMDKAKDELAKSEAITDDLLNRTPKDQALLREKSLNLFRQAEIAHALGQKAEAKRLYLASQEISKSIGDDSDAALYDQLLKDVE